ncbi:MAG: class I SAM-dependent methyltransferase [Nitrospinales bacterium]
MTQKAKFDRIAKSYDFLKSGDTRRWAKAQMKFFRQMRGRVLYVGVGTGQEIAHFPSGLHITAIDISRNMLEQCRKRATRYPGRIELALMDTEILAFPDNTFDTILTVCTFCSVEHPVLGLRELRRVLTPGGHILMFEHVLSRNPVFALILKSMSLVTTRLSGTHLDRDTAGNLKKAGFTIHSERNVYLDIVKAIAGHK